MERNNDIEAVCPRPRNIRACNKCRARKIRCLPGKRPSEANTCQRYEIPTKALAARKVGSFMLKSIQMRKIWLHMLVWTPHRQKDTICQRANHDRGSTTQWWYYLFPVWKWTKADRRDKSDFWPAPPGIPGPTERELFIGSSSRGLEDTWPICNTCHSSHSPRWKYYHGRSRKADSTIPTSKSILPLHRSPGKCLSNLASKTPAFFVAGNINSYLFKDAATTTKSRWTFSSRTKRKDYLSWRAKLGLCPGFIGLHCMVKCTSSSNAISAWWNSPDPSFRYPMHKRPLRNQLFQFMQIAMTMVSDLRLAQQVHNKEALNASIACYNLSCL